MRSLATTIRGWNPSFDPVPLTPWIVGASLISAIFALLAKRQRIAAVLIGVAVLAGVIALAWPLASPSSISTSYVERQNLSIRVSMRRFTRLTNAFSKKVENHAAMVGLHFMNYNFGRPHISLGKNTTPAMAAGISDHVWTCEEIAGLIED